MDLNTEERYQTQHLETKFTLWCIRVLTLRVLTKIWLTVTALRRLNLAGVCKHSQELRKRRFELLRQQRWVPVLWVLFLLVNFVLLKSRRKVCKTYGDLLILRISFYTYLFLNVACLVKQLSFKMYSSTLTNKTSIQLTRGM